MYGTTKVVAINWNFFSPSINAMAPLRHICYFQLWLQSKFEYGCHPGKCAKFKSHPHSSLTWYSVREGAGQEERS